MRLFGPDWLILCVKCVPQCCNRKAIWGDNIDAALLLVDSVNLCAFTGVGYTLYSCILCV